MSTAAEYQQWLLEAGLAEEDADRLALSLENVESPAWMEDLTLEELFGLAFPEGIRSLNESSFENDDENED